MPRKKGIIKSLRGKRLKMLIEEQGINQTQLAKLIPISQQTVSKIIQGKANLTEETARRVSELFPGSMYTFEKLMGYDQEPISYDTPLEFEKDWHRIGGGAHPPTNIIVAEARIAVALEKMNKTGWCLAVNLVETLSKMPEYQKSEERKKDEDS